MYPNQGGYPNQPYPSNQSPYPAPFGSNMPYPPGPGAQGMGMPQPMQSAFPPNPSYPPQPQGGYFPPQGAGFPPQGAPGFPPQQPMYPQSNFPPQQGYPTQQQPGYPQMQSPPQSGYPGMQSPPQSGYPQMQSPPGAYPMAPTMQGNQYGGEIPMQQHYAAASYSAPPQHATAVRRGRPTVAPHPNFDASNDAAVLRKAMKGFGTDENALINVLCRRPNHQRMEIVRAYKTAYGKDLINDIKSETSGNFESVLVALCTPTVEYYAQELNIAMSGAGTDEDALIEVMCTMSNAEIKQIGATYYRIYGRSLEETLRGDTSGNVKRLFTSLSVGGRDESMVTNIEQARNDAQALKRAGVDRWGTDESEFNRILCLRNYEQLKLICEEYKKLTGNTLEKDIKKEFSGDIEDALLAIIRVACNRPEFFARRLHKSMAGMGTNDRSLIRLCVTRSEIDMQDVKDEFQRYYSKSLKSWLKGDTSGHYRNALYALCGETP